MKSCPSEESLSIYVDGELTLDHARELESHVIQCRQCRNRIMAVREEAMLLADFLHDRVRSPVHVVASHTRARGLAIGLAPAVGVAALVATVIGSVFEVGLPSGTSWLNPLHLMGVYDMVFDTIFVLRDRAPALVDLAIAIGALFSVASLLALLAGTLGKRLVGPGVVLLVAGVSAALAPAPATAIELRTHEDSVVVAAGETLAETLIVSAKSVRIDGRIEGDLYALAERITIDGAVEGSVFAVGDEVEISGVVDDTLYVAGERVRLEGHFDDLYAFSEDLEIDERAVIERDVTIFGEFVRMDGATGRDFFFRGERIELKGEIGRDLTAAAREVELLDGTRVARDFDSRTPDGEAPRVAEGVTIGGERNEGVLEPLHTQKGHWQDPGFYLSQLVIMVSAFLVGLLLHVLRPGLFGTVLPGAGDFFRELGIGFIAFVVTPIAIILCCATVVGIPIGVIGLFTFLTALFVSFVLVAALVGSSLVGGGESLQRFGLALLLGLLVVTVAINLPFVGRLLWFVTVMTGLGMLIAHVRDSYRLRSA